MVQTMDASHPHGCGSYVRPMIIPLNNVHVQAHRLFGHHDLTLKHPGHNNIVDITRTQSVQSRVISRFFNNIELNFAGTILFLFFFDFRSHIGLTKTCGSSPLYVQEQMLVEKLRSFPEGLHLRTLVGILDTFVLVRN